MRGPCSVPGCGGLHIARTFCSKHYARWHRSGDPLAVGTEPGAPARFIRNVAARHQNGCLDWPFARNKKGYAQLTPGDRITASVSRLVCILVNGPRPSPRIVIEHTRVLSGFELDAVLAFLGHDPAVLRPPLPAPTLLDELDGGPG